MKLHRWRDRPAAPRQGLADEEIREAERRRVHALAEEEAAPAVIELPAATAAIREKVEGEPEKCRMSVVPTAGEAEEGKKTGLQGQVSSACTFAFLDAVVASDEGGRVEGAEAVQEGSIGNDAAPALARTRGTDEVERHGEAHEDGREQLVGDVVHRRRQGVPPGFLATVCHGHGKPYKIP